MFKRVLLLLICLSMAFPAWAAQEFLLGDIVIEGNQRVKTIDVLNAMQIKPGQKVTPADIDAAMADVYRMERFSDIAAEISEESGITVLTFKVEERPLVRNIRFEGNEELSADKLREVITIRVPDIYDPFEVAKSIDMIKAEYVKEGYYAAAITADSHVNKDNETLVTFRIKEGEIVRIKDIRFDGNTVFSDSELQKAMETREKWIFSWITGRGNYNETLLQQDLERIADLYFNQGYVRVKVREPVISLVDNGKHMLMLIHIDEGPQYKIGNIDVQGDLLQEKEQLLDLVGLAPGDVFSREKLRQGVSVVTDVYADQGYAYANISPLTRADDETQLIDLMLDIEKGPQMSVERINITGNTKTRDKVVRREMKLVEGDLFNATNLKKSKARINNLGFFEAVDISTSAGSDENLMNVDVNVKERSTGTFSVGAGYSSVDGFVAQGSVTQENFLGRAWRLNLAASLGGSSTTYQLGLTDPYFLDTRWTLGAEVYKTEREWDDFSRKATGFAIKGGHPIGEYSRILGTYRFEDKEIYDVSPFASIQIRDQEGTSTLSSFTTSYMYNTTNNRLDPSSGTDLSATWEFAGLGGTEKFSKYILDTRHFWPWKWGTVFSLHSQFGYVHSLNSDDVPIDERFYLGGIYTMRGFDSREVGPRDENGDFVGGDTEAFFNFEYIFPLFEELKIKGVTFFDVGNAWGDYGAEEDADPFGSWRYSVGAGIRWLSPLGPMRFEYGVNLDPREYESGSKFDFMIGRFF
ncbi:MAG: outer membrane protein assembly factor BamA [Desulfuromonadales bacterium]|nr:outer membrane protein assembly factor BamA [Desulfuromonadales bacterium]